MRSNERYRMGELAEMAERLWDGSADTTHVHPVMQRFAEPEEFAEGVLVFKGLATTNVIDTGDGLVMLDTGAFDEVEWIHAGVRAWRPAAPLRAAVFSHHHIDHIFGVGPFDEEAASLRLPAPTVYGHEAMPAHFDRYLRTGGWYESISIRQFGYAPGDLPWPDEYRFPDITYADALTVPVGNLTMELHHARGETEDATWTWIPERKLVATGDLFIWALPNASYERLPRRRPWPCA